MATRYTEALYRVHSAAHSCAVVFTAGNAVPCNLFTTPSHSQTVPDESALTLTHPINPSRPGSVVHVPASDTHRAHRELHFRLLRHDLVGEISSQLLGFKGRGGVGSLPQVRASALGCVARIKCGCA